MVVTKPVTSESQIKAPSAAGTPETGRQRTVDNYGSMPSRGHHNNPYKVLFSIWANTGVLEKNSNASRFLYVIYKELLVVHYF